MNRKLAVSPLLSLSHGVVNKYSLPLVSWSVEPWSREDIREAYFMTADWSLQSNISSGDSCFGECLGTPHRKPSTLSLCGER